MTHDYLPVEPRGLDVRPAHFDGLAHRVEVHQRGYVIGCATGPTPEAAADLALKAAALALDDFRQRTELETRLAVLRASIPERR